MRGFESRRSANRPFAPAGTYVLISGAPVTGVSSWLGWINAAGDFRVQGYTDTPAGGWRKDTLRHVAVHHQTRSLVRANDHCRRGGDVHHHEPDARQSVPARWSEQPARG